jgi:glycine cleavage system H lipoate-binding protein
MSAAIELLQSAGVFVVGLLARAGLFLAILLAIALPALAIALLIRGVRVRRERQLGLRRVAGLVFRPGVTYTPGHTWLHARNGGGTLELGIDDLAQRILPAVSAVEARAPGTHVERGDPVVKLHGGGRAVSIPAPVAGTVAGVNAAVLRNPALVKRDGYGKGWLVAITPSDRAWEGLPRDSAAETFLRNEADRFNRFLEEQLGFAAADGGELLAPAPWLVGEKGWREMTEKFLGA